MHPFGDSPGRGSAMRFKNREEAAFMLAGCLTRYRGQQPLVLGVARGGVPMARIIADALHGDLDVVLVRKLRAPGQPELALGAIAEDLTILKGPYFDELASHEYVTEETRVQREVLQQKRELYTRARKPADPAGRIVIIVDDGMATASSVLSAIAAVRSHRPTRLVVAVGVAPPESLARVRSEADEVICLLSPQGFYSVGQFFVDFSEVSDERVVAALAQANHVAVATPAGSRHD
jgi:predicted phosphoribosyltransferase